MKKCWKRSVACCGSSLLVLLMVASAQAQESPPRQLPDVTEPCLASDAGLQLAQQGVAGMWFEMSVARCILGRLNALPLYADRVSLLEARLRLSDERHDLVTRQAALSREAEERAVGALETAARNAREASEALAFERHLRWLWFGLGVVIVAVVQGLAIWGLSAIDGD